RIRGTTLVDGQPPAAGLPARQGCSSSLPGCAMASRPRERLGSVAAYRTPRGSALAVRSRGGSVLPAAGLAAWGPALRHVRGERLLFPFMAFAYGVVPGQGNNSPVTVEDSST